MKRRYLILLCGLAAATCRCEAAYAIAVEKSACEMLENPLCVEPHALRFGWQLRSDKAGDRQTAYHLLVASSREQLDGNVGDLWDSRKVPSPQSQRLPYGGAALQAGARCHWKVMAWGADGDSSAWSEPATFDLAPLINEVNVRWIGAIKKAGSRLPEGRGYNPPFKQHGHDTLFAKVDTLAKRSILLRKQFDVKKPVARAMLYASGLGHYELRLNGQRVGKSVFAPLWSDYDKTVYYNAYDVSAMLQQGSNALGAWLGNGFYNCSESSRYRKLLVSFGPPTMFLALRVEYADGSTATVSSDRTWRYAPSPITYNSIYGGEDYDANLEQAGWDTPAFDDSGWRSAVVQESPQGRLRPQLAPSVEVMQQFGVARWWRPQENTLVLDMGQNLSGMPTISVKGKKGQVVRLYPAECLTADSLANQKRTGSPYYFEYTLRGDEEGEAWTPRFSYYGYQYLQAENVCMAGEPNDEQHPVLVDVVSNFIHSSAPAAGTFECSNSIFNKAHALINNAVKSNMQAVFTDCPHREKLGWLEQVHLNGPGLMYSYDLAQLLPKVMQDMADAQWSNGLVPSIAPEYTVFREYMDFSDSPEWGAAVAVVPWMYYHFYGDSSLIARYFDAMRRYADYLTSRATQGIVSHGLGDWYDYGEHAAGYAKNTPIALSATAHYYYVVKLTADAAAMLHEESSAEKYSTLAETIRWTFNNKFFDADHKQYGTGSQASNAMPLFMGIVEPQHRQEVLDNLVKDIRQHGNRLTTGDVGNRYLYQALARNGYSDVMYALHNHYDAPGYGFQTTFGLTTLTEQWDPRKGNSWNHFMMGQIEEWFFRSLAGIAPDDQQPGFSHFFVEPTPVDDLTYVKASHSTPYGDIRVRWTSEGDVFTLHLSVPVNTTATLTLPYATGASILVNGAPLADTPTIVRQENAKLLVGSGEYTFRYEEQ